MTEIITIDAAGKSIGRVASEAVKFLLGKHRATYAPEQDAGAAVTVENLRKARWTGRKLEQKEYHRTSGYQGGLKTVGAAELWIKNPAEMFRHAVYSMLPNNRLRAARMKRLKIL